MLPSGPVGQPRPYARIRTTASGERPILRMAALASPRRRGRPSRLRRAGLGDAGRAVADRRERVANRLETLPLDFLGRPGAPVVTASTGAVPFGFGITPQGTIVVSEAGASTVFSDRDGLRRPAHGDRLAARRPGRRVLGRRLAERAVRLHGKRRRRHQRLRDRARRLPHGARHDGAPPVTARPRLRRERPLPPRREPGPGRSRRTAWAPKARSRWPAPLRRPPASPAPPAL